MVDKRTSGRAFVRDEVEGSRRSQAIDERR